MSWTTIALSCTPLGLILSAVLGYYLGTWCQRRKQDRDFACAVDAMVTVAAPPPVPDDILEIAMAEDAALRSYPWINTTTRGQA